MMFLGNSFVGDNHSLDSSVPNIQTMKEVTVTNGVYDSIYGTKEIIDDWNGEKSHDWDYDTLFNAEFHDNLFGGNVDFSYKNVDKIKVKRRRVGEYTYDTMYEIPIAKNEDFQFEIYDRLCGIGEYEYALVPTLNEVEGNINSNKVKSEFTGFYMLDSGDTVKAIANLSTDSHRVRSGSTVTTLGSRMPYYVSNGAANYVEGTVDCTFVEMDKDCNFLFENSWRYREKVDNFLTNGRPKIFKDDSGRLYLVSIKTDTLSSDHDGHPDNVIHHFEWQQCGNAEKWLDLYKAGLVTVAYNAQTVTT